MVSFFSGTSQDYVDMYLAAAEGMLVSSTWFSAHYLQAISADHNVVPVLIPYIPVSSVLQRSLSWNPEIQGHPQRSAIKIQHCQCPP